MPLMDEETKNEVKKIFSGLTETTKIVFFKENLNCPLCPQTEEFLKELVSLSDKIQLEVYNKYSDEEKTKEYNPEMTPAVFVEGKKSQKRVIFYGIPAGYEFVSLLEAIKTANNEQVELENETLEKLKEINKPVVLKVFVTPTCPYCPAAVVMAHKFALANPNIIGQMIEANEFPQISMKYQVEGVPKIVVNEKVHLVGAQPESKFLSAILDSQK